MSHIQNKETSVARLIKDFSSSWKMKFFFWRRLPSLGFWGVKVVSLSADQAAVSIPYNHRTQNPFRSIYFAAQAGAAELSTGLLALLALEGRGRASMLVTGFSCEFFKKATSQVVFTCNEGKAVQECIDTVFTSPEGAKLVMTSEGRSVDGELVTRVKVEWSFKAK